MNIDLRSDTVTKPTPAMWEAMAKAELGDDVYVEDPTVNRLEAYSADLLEKEAALFVPSGTMGNLIALLTHCGRSDEVITGDKAHTFLYEVGGMAALGGVIPHTLPNQPDGTLKLDDIQNAIRVENVHFPRTKLITLENTQNECGGAVLPPSYTKQVREIADDHGLVMHLDGARLFNAAVKLGVSPAELSADFDSVTFCLSKGLCAPVGSVLCGSKPFIDKARKVRKQLGGGMRQAGVIAAAGLVAITEMIDRLEEDHLRAQKLAAGLAEITRVKLRPNSPQTNMIYFDLDLPAGQGIDTFIAGLKAEGILVGGVGPYSLRLVTHYWIDDAAVENTISVFSKLLSA